MPDEMDIAAAAAKIERIVTFDQRSAVMAMAGLADAGGQDGICFGLSIVWLEYQRRQEYSRFFEDIRAHQDEATLLRAAGISLVIQADRSAPGIRYRNAAKQAGLAVATEDDGASKMDFFSSRDEADMRKLADWMAAAAGERYFLIETAGHAMAATGSRTGKLQFFDPNFGVVACWSAKAMASFLGTFLTQDRLKARYWSKASNLRDGELHVHKFKKA